MVAFVSFVALLAAAPTLFAAPIVLQPHGARSYHSHHRRACINEIGSEDPSSDPTSTRATKTDRPTTTSSVDTKPTKAPGGGSFAVWPIPVSNAKAIWSTAAEVPGHVKLSDEALNIYSGANTPHVYTDAPDGSPSLRAFYEKGSISPGHSGGRTPGFSLYSKTGIDLSEGTEVLFSYKAYFQDGFEFKQGGKMPGLYGGVNDAIAKTCSGGNHGGGKCWSARMMFRPGGDGELYAYFPQLDSNDKILANVEPKTESNPAYGSSVGRGSFTWKRGAWTSISQRIKLNDVGKKNGEFEVWADGKSIMSISGLVFRTSEESLVRGAQIETFFGGHDPSWASPKDQYTWFKDFSAAVLA